MQLRFNRHELAGSLGDLGTLLPLAFGLIAVNGIDATATFLAIGLFYILAGLYFGITVPVQPMKVISAYAIASALSPLEVSAAGLWIGALLLVLGASGGIRLVRRLVPQATVRGVQLVTGVLLMVRGIEFMLGRSGLQQARGSAEPFLAVDRLGPLPLGLVLGIAAVLVILLLLDHRRAPAALVVLAGGAAAGLALGGWQGLAGLEPGLHLPQPLPFGLPSASVWVLALTALALPQLPMTLGNAVLAQSDLTREYFGAAAGRRASPRALAVSMGLANLACAVFGAMPLCHGAGGLAAHYRFGARSAGSNLMIGTAMLAVGLLLGDQAPALLGLLPFAVLGALLCFAGAQLAMTVRDVERRADVFVVVVMLAVSLASNLAIGFGIGIALALLFEHTRLGV
jgi:SulP family sulfate permease